MRVLYLVLWFAFFLASGTANKQTLAGKQGSIGTGQEKTLASLDQGSVVIMKRGLVKKKRLKAGGVTRIGRCDRRVK